MPEANVLMVDPDGDVVSVPASLYDYMVIRRYTPYLGPPLPEATGVPTDGDVAIYDDGAEAFLPQPLGVLAQRVVEDPGFVDGVNDVTEPTRTAVATGRLSELALDAAYLGAVVLTGPGIDPTGATDSTAAIQAKMDSVGILGANVYLPPGLYTCTSPILMEIPNVRLWGAGTLQFTAGVTNTGALQVLADNCTVDGIRITNPNLLGLQTGGQGFGIYIEANQVKINGCRVDSFQMGIGVSANGEWLDWRITNNSVLVLGAGDGPADLTSDKGEDRGDGIVSWGARGVIVGNIVEARPGTDARIGIHAEGLDNYQASNPRHSNEMVTISGNVVFGQFRRGITSEGVKRVSITGNSIADSTWWAIVVTQNASGSVISGNAIHWTRQPADDQGQAWSPIRSPIMIYGNTRGVAVVGNAITLDGEANSIICLQSVGSEVSDSTIISGNTVYHLSGEVAVGVRTIGPCKRVAIHSNIMRGFVDFGVYAYQAESMSIKNNVLHGVACEKAILLQGATGVTSACGNEMEGFSVGIECSNAQWVQLNDNVFNGGAVGVDLFGTINARALNNFFVGTADAYLNEGGYNVSVSG